MKAIKSVIIFFEYFSIASSFIVSMLFIKLLFCIFEESVSLFFTRKLLFSPLLSNLSSSLISVLLIKLKSLLSSFIFLFILGELLKEIVILLLYFSLLFIFLILLFLKLLLLYKFIFLNFFKLDVLFELILSFLKLELELLDFKLDNERLFLFFPFLILVKE